MWGKPRIEAVQHLTQRFGTVGMLSTGERARKRKVLTIERDRGVTLAIEAAGGLRPLARALGISAGAIFKWQRIPADRLLRIEAVTGVPREKLRPDLYRGRK
jgi:hypothetical protein